MRWPHVRHCHYKQLQQALVALKSKITQNTTKSLKDQSGHRFRQLPAPSSRLLTHLPGTRSSRLLFAVCVIIVLAPLAIYLALHPQPSQAAWWQGSSGGTNWAKRQRVPLVNNSGATIHKGTTVAVTVDTKALVAAGKLQADCDDLRILYQPNDNIASESARFLSYPGGGSCSTSEATKVYFRLNPNDSDLTDGSTNTNYYIYYDNPKATTPTSIVDAYDTVGANALLVCPFDGTTNCINGAGTVTPTPAATGAIRYSGSKSALSFDGVASGDTVTAANSSPIQNIANSDFTVETWFYIPSKSGNQGYMGILSKGNWGSTGWGLITATNQRGFQFRVRLSTTDIDYNISSPLYSLDTWNHVAITFNSDTKVAIMYVNGIAQTPSSAGSGGADDDSASNLNIGLTGSSYLTGSIDETRISNVIRYSSNFTPQTAPFVRDEHTKLLYHFDENGDDPRNTGKAIDDSGNGNDGTITGAKHVAGLVGVDSSTSDTGKADGGNAYGGHEGIFIEEGTTNKITNPSFENSTAYDTNWIDPSADWWTQGGISGSNVVAAYQPLGAASYTTSKSNLANPGTYDAYEGSAPGWDASYGWRGNGTSNYLQTGITTVGLGWSAVIKFANDPASDGRLFGASSYWTMQPDFWDAFSTTNWSTSNLTSTYMSAGTGGIAGAKGYENGISIGTATQNVGPEGYELYVISGRHPGGPQSYYGGDIHALAFYDTTLSDAQMLALHQGLLYAGTGLTATENTTAPYYKFGSQSVKLVTTYIAGYTTTVDAGNTNTHTLSAYVYNGTSGSIGGTVDATVAKLIFNGTAQTTTYTDMGGGWWRLTYTDAAGSGSQAYGVEIEAGKTIYLDGVQLEQKAYATTYADGSLTSDEGGTDTYFWDDNCNGTLDAGEDLAPNTTCSSRTTVNLTYSATNNISNTAGSVSFWTKFTRPSTDINSGTFTDILFPSGVEGHYFNLRYSWGNDRFEFRKSVGSTVTANVSKAFSANEWIYVVATWDTTNGISLYINSGTPGTNPDTTSPASLNKIQLYFSTTSKHFLSDFRVFDTALTPTQVTDLYRAGLVSHSDNIEVDRFSTNKGLNPVAIYHFDSSSGSGQAYDSSQYGNHLAVSDATFDTQSGDFPAQLTSTLKFDGSTSMASRSAGLSRDFNFGTDSFSLSGWFRHPSTISGSDTLVSKYTSSTGYKVYMNSSGYLCFDIGDGSNTDSLCSNQNGNTTSYADSSWHHFEAVDDQTTGSEKTILYIDGAQIAINSAPTTVNSVSNNANFAVGVDASKSNFWDGFLDEIVVYPYARTSDQVKGDVLGSQTAVSFGQQAKDPLSEGLVGYWKMDESSGNASDSSGNGNTGTWTGTGSHYQSGKYGNGGGFNGSDDYVVITSTDSINVKGPFTLSSWLYTTSAQNQDWKRLFYKDVSTSYSFGTGSGSGRDLSFWLENSEVIDTDEILTDNEWQLVTVTYDGNRAIIYRNGVYVKDGNYSGPISGNSANLELGGNAIHSLRRFSGKLDDMRVYNRALSSKEVKQLFEWAPGPVGYWKLDESSGTTAYDTSGNSNNSSSFLGNPAWTTGKFSSGLNFPGGSSTGVVINDSLTLHLTDFTLEAWVKPNVNNANQAIISKRNSYATMDWEFYLTSDGKLEIQTGENGFVAQLVGCSYSAGSWIHVAITKNYNRYIFYTNGVQCYAATETGQWTDSENVTLGTLEPTGNATLNGILDEAKIYNYARTQEQVISDMNAGHPAPGSPVGSPVLNLDFNEGYGDIAHDSSPQSNNGHLADTATCPGASNCPTWTNNGKFNKALYFDGVDDRVNVDLNTSLDAGGWNAITLSAWVNTSNVDITNSMDTILMLEDDHNANVNEAIRINVLEGQTADKYKFQFGIYASNNASYSVTSTREFTDGSGWHLITATMDHQYLHLYIDGQEYDPPTYVGAVTIKDNQGNGEDWIIGSGEITSNRFFNGTLDDVKIYNFPLTLDQIATEYNQGSAQVMGALSSESSAGAADQNAASRAYCIPGDTNPCNSPVGEWNFDEKSGTSAYDTSGNGKTGTFNGNYAWKTGKTGSGGWVDGNSSYVGIPNLGLNGAYTLEYWVYPDNASLTYDWNSMWIDYSWFNNGFRLTHFGCTSTYMYHQLSGSDSSANWTHSSICNGWHHVAATFDGSGTAVMYVDGINQGDKSITPPVWASSTGRLFTWKSSNSTKFDNTKIYNYARTPAQIAWDYNRGAPVAQYNFDECSGDTAHDTAPKPNASATTYDGTIHPVANDNTTVGTCKSGTSTEMWNDGTNGKYNGSLGFDGNDDYVSTSNVALLALNAGTYTNISWGGWFNPTASPTSDTLIHKNNEFRLTTDSNGYPQCEIYSGSWQTAASDSTTLPTSTWTHLLCTYDGTNLKLYINGTLSNTQPQSNSLTSSSSTALNFARDSADSGYFNGLIDEVNIYNYALTDTQAKTLYNNNSAIYIKH